MNDTAIWRELLGEADRTPQRVRVRPADAEAMEAFERDWQPPLRASGAQDAEWPWRAELQESAASSGRVQKNGLAWELFALVGEDGALHGLSSLKHPVDSSQGLPLVYVERLSVAPWNRLEAKPNRRLLGCGAVLLRHAVERSVTLGFGGRLGLHSLSDAHTHGFYERAGMRCLDEQELPGEGKLRYYELDEGAAEALLAGTKR